MMAWLAFLWNSPVSEFPRGTMTSSSVKSSAAATSCTCTAASFKPFSVSKPSFTWNDTRISWNSRVSKKNNLKIHACFQHWKHMQRSPWNHIHLGYTDYTPLESCEHRICSKLWLCGEELQRTFSTFSAFSPFTFAAGSRVQGTGKKLAAFEGVCWTLSLLCHSFNKMSQGKQEKYGKVWKSQGFQGLQLLGRRRQLSARQGKESGVSVMSNEMTLGTRGRQKRQETPWTWFIWLCFTVVFQRYYSLFISSCSSFFSFFVSFPSCSFIFHDLYFNLRNLA